MVTLPVLLFWANSVKVLAFTEFSPESGSASTATWLAAAERRQPGLQSHTELHLAWPKKGV